MFSLLVGIKSRQVALYDENSDFFSSNFCLFFSVVVGSVKWGCRKILVFVSFKQIIHLFLKHFFFVVTMNMFANLSDFSRLLINTV